MRRAELPVGEGHDHEGQLLQHGDLGRVCSIVRACLLWVCMCACDHEGPLLQHGDLRCVCFIVRVF